MNEGSESEYQGTTTTEPTYSNAKESCVTLSRDQLTVIRQLGSGQYGRVFLAEVLIPKANTSELKKVAVKTTKGKVT